MDEAVVALPLPVAEVEGPKIIGDQVSGQSDDANL